MNTLSYSCSNLRPSRAERSPIWGFPDAEIPDSVSPRDRLAFLLAHPHFQMN